LADNLYRIKADQGQIEQTLLNLYLNAADAMAQGGNLVIETKNVTNIAMQNKPYKPRPGKYILLTIKDSGIGMDKKIIDRIFEPFFTTKGFAKGTGLGLAAAYGIIKGHGGYIDVDSKLNHGAMFNIYLPAMEKEVLEEEPLSIERVNGKGIVLLVDDEDMVLDTGRRMLIKLGFEVLVARNGHEALELFRMYPDEIDMVLLDMIMPDMGGGEVYDRIKEINPNIKVLLVSGYGIDGQVTEILRRGCNGFIQKPFSLTDLSREIGNILGEKY
jgi:two-component system cell cycle sensor histidine kinase/response regulator CckA